MTNNSPLDKIQVLDSIEKEIVNCVQSAGNFYQQSKSKTRFYFNYFPGQSLQELSKEKSSQKAAETHTQAFLKSLSIVESKLSEQINYLTQVSTGQAHEGSGYAAAKVLQMAWHRIHHAKSRVRELEESKAKYVAMETRRSPATRNGTASASTQQQQTPPVNHQQQQGGGII